MVAGVGWGWGGGLSQGARLGGRPWWRWRRHAGRAAAQRRQQQSQRGPGTDGTPQLARPAPHPTPHPVQVVCEGTLAGGPGARGRHRSCEAACCAAPRRGPTSAARCAAPPHRVRRASARAAGCLGVPGARGLHVLRPPARLHDRHIRADAGKCMHACVLVFILGGRGEGGVAPRVWRQAGATHASARPARRRRGPRAPPPLCVFFAARGQERRGGCGAAGGGVLVHRVRGGARPRGGEALLCVCFIWEGDD